MDNVEELCKEIAEQFKYHSDDVAIDLTVDGYVSYIEIGGKVLARGGAKKTIEKSLESLRKKLYASFKSSS